MLVRSAHDVAFRGSVDAGWRVATADGASLGVVDGVNPYQRQARRVLDVMNRNG
jgi:hypothetical protein